MTALLITAALAVDLALAIGVGKFLKHSTAEKERRS